MFLATVAEQSEDAIGCLEFELAGKGTLPSVLSRVFPTKRRVNACRSGGCRSVDLDLERSLLGMMVFWMLLLS